jgi:hypothetical protein
MSRIWWIPDWVGNWADRHPYFRNFPPFAALSATLFFVWSLFTRMNVPDASMSAFPRFSIWQRALVCALLVSVLGTALEFLQQLVPERFGNFHQMQIFWSVVGALFGALCGFGVGMAIKVYLFADRKTGVAEDRTVIGT